MFAQLVLASALAAAAAAQRSPHDASKCLEDNGRGLEPDADCVDCSAAPRVGCADNYTLAVERHPTNPLCHVTHCYPPAAAADPTTTTTTTTNATEAPMPMPKPAWDPSNCILGAHATCWADTAYQRCPVDRQGAYDAVKAKGGAGDAKAMHAVYLRLITTGVGCTRRGGAASVYLGDDACTTASPCTEGQGDCDGDGDCLGGLLCGHRKHHDAMPRGIVASKASHIAGQGDYCFAPEPGVPSEYLGLDSCTTASPCTEGQGDCDGDGDCLGGLLCGHRKHHDAMPRGIVASKASHIAGQGDYCFAPATTTTATATTTTAPPCSSAGACDAPHDAANCPFNSKVPATCWGNSAFQRCPAGRQAAYDAVMAKRGDIKAMHDVYVALLSGAIPGCKTAATTTTATAATAAATTAAPHDAANCPFNSKVPATCWGNSAFQRCPAGRQAAYDAVMAKRGDTKAMHDVYVALLSGAIPGCKATATDTPATAVPPLTTTTTEPAPVPPTTTAEPTTTTTATEAPKPATTAPCTVDQVGEQQRRVLSALQATADAIVASTKRIVEDMKSVDLDTAEAEAELRRLEAALDAKNC